MTLHAKMAIPDSPLKYELDINVVNFENWLFSIVYIWYIIPPSPFKSWWSCSKCFMMIDVWMLGRDWGCGVRDPSRRQVLSQWMGLGPSGGSLTHPPLPLLIWGLMLFLIKLFVMIILWMFWGDWGWGMHDTPRRQILSQRMGLGPSGRLRIHLPLPPP